MSATLFDNSTAVSGKTVLEVQCAWCGRVKRGGVFSGPSMPLVHEISGHSVSHGICPACMSKVGMVETAARAVSTAYGIAA